MIDGTIFQYQIIQKKIDCFFIIVATNEDPVYVEKTVSFFVNQTILKNAVLKFEFYKFIIPNTKIGKHRFFINEVV